MPFLKIQVQLHFMITFDASLLRMFDISQPIACRPTASHSRMTDVLINRSYPISGRPLITLSKESKDISRQDSIESSASFSACSSAPSRVSSAKRCVLGLVDV